MSERLDALRVDPGTLHSGGTKVATAAQAAQTAFSMHHARIEDAMSGWSPASRAAMTEKLDQWKSRTDRLATDVVAHGESIKAAAAAFAMQDAENAKVLKTADERM